MARREPLPPPRRDGEQPTEQEPDEFPRIVFVLGIIGFTLGIVLLIVVARA